MITELWKPIAGYKGYYEISNLGKVRSLVRNNGYGSRRSMKVRAMLKELDIY